VRRLFLGVIATLLFALIPGTASAQATSFTETVRGVTETFPEVNPCSGATGTVTVTYNAIFHVTDDPQGGFHITGTQTGTFTFVPNDASEPSFTGRFTTWFGGNVSTNTDGFWSTFRVRGTGSDGSTLLFNAVEQFHVSNGEVHVEFFLENCR
jgi:hypothetical protein